MVLGLVRWITGSVITCIALHGAYNLGSVVLGEVMAGDGDGEPGMMGVGLFMAAAFIGAWLCWFALGRLRPVRDRPQTDSTSGRD